MKRVVMVLALFAVVMLITVGAQAESKGEQVFKKKCAMCHVVMGQGGSIGPELTKVASKLKDKDLKEKLDNPKKTNPTSLMPSFKTLPKAEMDSLLGYLKTLK